MRIKGSVELKPKDLIYLITGSILLILAVQGNYEAVFRIVVEWLS